MGTKLFVRSSTGVALTPAGEAFVRYSDEIRRLSEEARTVLKQFSGGQKKEIRIGFYQPAATVLAPLISGLRSQYPEIVVIPVEMVPGVLIEELRAHKIDLALPGFAQRQLLSEFSGIKIPSAALTFVVPGCHRLAHRRRLGLAEVKDDRFVVLDEIDFPGCHSLIVEMCRQAGFAPQIFASAHSMGEAVAYVMTGECVTLLPESAVSLPEGADVKLVRCDTREDWFALWSSSNGKPELQVVVRVLMESNPAGWAQPRRAIPALVGKPRPRGLLPGRGRVRSK